MLPLLSMNFCATFTASWAAEVISENKANFLPNDVELPDISEVRWQWHVTCKHATPATQRCQAHCRPR